MGERIEAWRIVGWNYGEWDEPNFRIEYQDGTVHRFDLAEVCPEADAEAERTGELPDEWQRLMDECCEDCEATGKVPANDDWRWPKGEPMPTRWRPISTLPEWAARPEEVSHGE